MPKSQHNRFRMSFNTYGVNSRGEVIPVKSFGFGLSSDQSEELTNKAIKRAASLKNIKSLRYL